ncbi:nuclear transport factor 2 family protein [Streptomyces sp. NPDC060223]|uniref:nuclear transport factor 2 family protein n=1 Tax=unclassified Streptomyces TaxID=2593676 RepID=UPI00363F4EFF
MPRNEPQAINPDALPEVVTRYLTAHRARDTATAITAFTDNATVTDDGETHEGAASIEHWLSRTATEFTFTTQLIGAHRTDASHYTATQHLEGDFPGGTVDLHYRFTLRDNLVERLVIEP